MPVEKTEDISFQHQRKLNSIQLSTRTRSRNTGILYLHMSYFLPFSGAEIVETVLNPRYHIAKHKQLSHVV